MSRKPAISLKRGKIDQATMTV